MKAIVCKTFGPPESLVLEDVAPRPIGKGEVRIKVKAAGVNFPDTLIIQGKYQLKAEPPFTPGGEVAGEVIEAGEKVKHVRPGDAVAALQLGKLMGARVIAAAGSDDKLAFCKSQGADEVVNYAKDSLKEAVKKLTKGQGADVIYDPVGGELTQDCFSCINWNGRHLVVGFAAGKIPDLALNRLLLKGASAVGVFWGAFVAREPKLNWENFQQLFAWYGEGKLKPHVSKAYPLAQAGAALRDMLERRVTGKVVLVP